MAHQSRNLTLYTVVYVWRGCADSVKVYRRLAAARRYAKRISKGVDLLADDVQIFATSLRCTSHSRPAAIRCGAKSRRSVAA
jgi:hypothetical protein